MAIELGTAYISILPSTDKLAPAIRKELGKVEDDSSSSGERGGSNFAAGFKRRMGAALKGGLLAGATGVSLLGGLGIKTAAEMEQANIAFTTMLGSAEKAKTFIGELTDFAAKTPFEFPGLQTAATSLISAGIATRDVLPIMRTLGDVTSGMGTGAEGIQRATIALQQMSAAGRITGEDLNQLRDAGIPVFDLLAASTGKSKAEIVKLAQAGKLGSKELGQLMDGLKSGKGLEKFSGLMEKQAQSLDGQWSTFKDTLQMGLAEAIKPLIPLMKDGLVAATEALGPALVKVSDGLRSGMLWAKAFAAEWRANTGAGGQARAVFSTIASVLGQILSIGVAVVQWGNEHRTVVIALAAAFVALRLTVLAYNAAQKVAAAGGLAKYLLGVAKNTRIAQIATKTYTATKWLLTTALKAARIALTATATAARFVGTALLTAVTATARFIASTAVLIARTIASTAAFVAQRIVILAISAATKAWAAAQMLLNIAMSLNPFGLIVLAIVALVAVFVLAWKKSDTFRAIVIGTWNAIKAAAVRVFGFLKSAISTAFSFIKTAFLRFTILGLVISHWDKIKAATGAVVNFVKSKFNALVSFVRGLPGKIRGAAAGMWNSLKDGFRAAINGIVSIWNRLSFSINIPDAIPGLPDDWTFNTPDLPHFAKGGVVDEATLGVFGEAGTEAVVPLDRLEGWVDRAAQIGAGNADGRGYAKAASSTSSSGSSRVEFVITNWKTGEGFFREIADDAIADRDDFDGTTRRMR